MTVAKTTRAKSKGSSAVGTFSTRSTRGRKAEALKQVVKARTLTTSEKRAAALRGKTYRTRGDYTGDKWKNLVLNSTPGRYQKALAPVLTEETAKEIEMAATVRSTRPKINSVDKVRRKTTSTSRAKPANVKQVEQPENEILQGEASGNVLLHNRQPPHPPMKLEMHLENREAGTVVSHKLPTDLACRIIDVCSQFVIESATRSAVIADIDVHIRIKPTGST